MNLLQQMKKEIHQLNLKSKEEIAYFLYVRTGELFYYDPHYLFGTNEEKRDLEQNRVDIQNVYDFNIICCSWAHLYATLLHTFHIQAKVIENEYHSYVEFTIKDQEYIADITTGNMDINEIKFGKKIQNFGLKKNKSLFSQDQLNEKIHYKKGIDSERIIETILKRLQEKATNFEDYLFQVYKSLETILNARVNKDFMSGTTFIHHFLKQAFGEDYPISYARFFENEEEVYIEVYSIFIDSQFLFFAYQKQEDHSYQFHQISMKELQRIKMNAYTQNLARLTLQKKLEKFEKDFYNKKNNN